MKDVELKACIITTLSRRGKGTWDSPIRRITEVWDAETGELIGVSDPMFEYNLANESYERNTS